MGRLFPLDFRLRPPIYDRIADIPTIATEARLVGQPPDLDHPLESRRLDRLWLQNMTGEAAARLALHFDPVQLSLANVQTPDLNWIRRLGRLDDLIIDRNTKLESFAFLKGASPLTRLRADSLMRVTRLDELGDQPALKSLWIGGGLDRKITIASLDPLSMLRFLEELFLVSMKLERAVLSPLSQLRRLRRLSLQSNLAPMEEYARLAGDLTDVECDVLRGFMTLGWVLPRDIDLLDVIDQLDGDERVIMVGKGGRSFEVGRDRRRIIDQLLQFRAIRDSDAKAIPGSTWLTKE